jgi:hypothetical protein
MEVHLMWACGELPYRCHQFSVDRGEHWSVLQEKVFGDLHSLAYWDAVAVDRNQICWFFQLRYPEAVYYSCWLDGQWQDAQIMVNIEPLTQMHGLTASMKDGNVAVLGVYPPQGANIWFVEGEYEAEKLDSMPIQQSLVSPTMTPVEMNSYPAEPFSTSMFQDNTSVNQTILLQPIGLYIGVGFSVLLIIFVVVLKRLRV